TPGGIKVFPSLQPSLEELRFHATWEIFFSQVHTWRGINPFA
ncbi:unnamed protein product, partial [marine sediment metagenome]